MNLHFVVSQWDIKLGEKKGPLYFLPATAGLEARGVESPSTPSSSLLKGELFCMPLPLVVEPAGEER